MPRHSFGRVLQEEEQWLERQREWEDAGNKGYWDGLDEAGLAPEAADAEEGDTLSYSEYERRQRLAAFDAQEEAGQDRPPFVPGVQGSGIADSYNSDFAMGGGLGHNNNNNNNNRCLVDHSARRHRPAWAMSSRYIWVVWIAAHVVLEG